MLGKWATKESKFNLTAPGLHIGIFALPFFKKRHYEYYKCIQNCRFSTSPCKKYSIFYISLYKNICSTLQSTIPRLGYLYNIKDKKKYFYCSK